MIDRIPELESSSGEPFREDLARLYRVMRPATVACINVVDTSSLPLRDFLTNSRVWMVDWEPGRPRQAVSRELLASNPEGATTCLSPLSARGGNHLCGSYLPSTGASLCASFQLTTGPRCRNYSPGRQPQIVIGDGSLGRASKFVASTEAILAASDSATNALERAIDACHQAQRLEHRLAISTNSIELVVSMLTFTSEDGPFERFMRRMELRFGPELRRDSVQHRNRIAALRKCLLVRLMDAHARELYRLVDKRVGGLYFASHPVAPANDGSWALHETMPFAFEILGHYFALDFESFPAESFLRRLVPGKQVVQAALMRPLATPTADTTQRKGARS